MTQATARAPRAAKPAAEAAPKAEAKTQAKKAAAPNFDKARKAFADTRDFTKGNVEALTTSFGAASKGFNAVRDHSIAFAKARLEKNLAAAQSLTGAKSLADVLDVQNAFAKDAIEAYGASFGKLSQAVTAAAKDAAKPIGERARAVYASATAAR